jgi:iron complex outermembrane receptor protein
MDAVYDDADRQRSVRATAVRRPHLGHPRRPLLVACGSLDDRRAPHVLVQCAAAYSMGTDAATNTLGGRAQAQVGAGTTLGGEAFRRNWDTSTLLAGMAYAPQYSIPDVNIDTIGVFAEHTRSLGTRTAIDFCGRLDRIESAADDQKASLALFRAYHGSTTTSRTDVLPAGRVKVTHRATTGVQLAAGLGHNARVAEGNERFFALRRMGTDWVGNPDLAPSRNTGFDGSITLDGKGRSLSVNAFVNRVDGYIAVYMAPRVAMVPGVMNTSARSYTNVDALLRGLEVTGSTQLLTNLTFSGDVSYTRGTFDQASIPSATGNDLAEMPPLRAQARFRFDDGRTFGELGGIASAAQENVDTSLGEATTPSYFVLNLHAGLRAGAFAVSVGVANLLDHYYVEHLSYQRDPFRSGVRVAEPGRNVFMNATWQF